jgi:hypothetical protein
MSRKATSLLLCAASVAVIVGATSVFLGTSIESSSPLAHAATTSQVAKTRRNSFLQPEALRVARQLGTRFDTASRASLVMLGSLNVGGVGAPATLVRRQTQDGEIVELRLSDRSLTWNAAEGTKASASALIDEDRLTFERLIFDSPDHFVLAQFRGASYSVVARDVRPPNAPDDYSGPVWNIVRIDEPQTNKEVQAKSVSRLYHINMQTGLIDRVLSRVNDQSVEAQIISWSEQSGEKVPSQIIWSINGRAIMTYQATSISYTEQ